MKSRMKPRRRKGLSTVMSEIILASVVLAIGFSVWGYSSSVTSATSNSYVGDIQGQMDVLMERFTIEHITYINSTQVLRVWVYNYGGNDIVLNLFAFNGGQSWSTLGTTVAARSIIPVDISLTIASGNQLAIEAVSVRENYAHATYFVP